MDDTEMSKRSTISSKNETDLGTIEALDTLPRTNGIDPVAERRLVKKLDLILLPMFTLMYALNFIDRIAIGNAKIAGLEKDLGLIGYDYNVCLTIFYLFFIVSEVPSNLALKHFGSVFLGITTTVFGLVTIGTAFVTGKSGLIASRVFLGIAEGGTQPGLTYILSRYYTRKELVFRIGIFFGCAPLLAGAFGGLLASGLLSVPSIGSVDSWRKIFLVEGIITTGFGLLAIVFLPADPESSRMLNEEERALALARIVADHPGKKDGKREPASWKLIKQALSFNTLLCSLAYFFLNVSFQGLNLFMPTVIASLGHFTTVQSQLRTVPPYVASLAWTVIMSYIGLRYRIRAGIIMMTLPLVVSGYIINVSTTTADVNARYAAAFLCLIGMGPPGPIFLAWATDNAAPDTMRAVTTALVPGLGSFGAIVAVWTYLPTDAPNFHNGNSLNVATSSSALTLAIIGFLYCRWENAKRARGGRDYRVEGKNQEEIEKLGYLHPEYRYQM